MLQDSHSVVPVAYCETVSILVLIRVTVQTKGENKAEYWLKISLEACHEIRMQEMIMWNFTFI
jgi:hypothetical protein